jgi:glycosyltransferase involved in cell wall biosynthesis
VDIIVVQPEGLHQFPLTISLLISLSKSHKIILVSKSENSAYSEFLKEHNIELIYNTDKIRLRYGILPALIERKWNNFKLWDSVSKRLKRDTLVWSTSEKSVHLFGSKYLKVNHIMQLMELIESPTVKESDFLGKATNLSKIAQNAKVTVVPEYNRAHLMKLWWKLDKIPFLLPNKLTLHPRLRNCEINQIDIKDKILRIIDSGKRIILYQGVVHEQRNLLPFINAINKLKDKYVLVLMTELNSFSKKLLFENPEIIHIPWIKAPQHLQITSWASIGLLSYEAKKMGNLSILNALYCAPNKIFEYSGFGIPMLSNDCPSLGPIFNQKEIGEIIDFENTESILEAILKIEKFEDDYIENCNSYFDEVDMDIEISKIISLAVK